MPKITKCKVGLNGWLLDSGATPTASYPGMTLFTPSLGTYISAQTGCEVIRPRKTWRENNRRVILTKKTNQNLLQCGRIIGMHEETSMLADVLEISVKCECHPPNAGDLTGLLKERLNSFFSKA